MIHSLLAALITGALSLQGTPDYCQQANVQFYDCENGGFVITAGNDGHLIGYADHGSAREALQNANLTNWLRTYCEYMATLEAQGQTLAEVNQANKRRRTRRAATAVEPMLKSRWGQTAPYWNLCPVDAQGYNCHTGCVATAMAQVMRYHLWPAQSKGEGHFYHPTYEDVAYTFGQEPYQWNLMTDSYTWNSNKSRKQAIALLMMECGAAVNMQYTSFGSSAYVSRVAHGLINNMGYSNTTRYLRRDWMTSDEWDDIIRTELEAGRPVVFGGQSQSFGHCFVIDGIDANGLLHVNWGWEGDGDGYYDVDYMYPPDTEATSGFNYTQEIVVGIQPPTASEEEQLAYGPCLYLMEGLTFSNKAPKRSGSFTLSLNKVYNTTGSNFDGLIGIGLFQDDSLIQVLKSTTLSLADINYLEKKTLMLNVPTDIEEGDYELRAVARGEGYEEWTPMATHINTQGIVSLHVAADGLLLTGRQAVADLQLADVSMNSHSVLPGSVHSVTISVRNDGQANYDGKVGLALVDNQGQGLWSQVMPMMAYGNRTTSTTFSVNMPTSVGTYTLKAAYLDLETQTTAFLDPDGTIDMTVEVTTGMEGIGDVRSNRKYSDEAPFNLNGCRVSVNYRGIMVQEGRKIIQK